MMEITTKTKNDGKNRGTFALLENVAPNLFRHRENQSYWGVKKMNGKPPFMHSKPRIEKLRKGSSPNGSAISGAARPGR